MHKYQNWNQELKNISDIYRDFRILFTGSSAIDIAKAKYDLSRRVTLHHLSGLSFREYLELYLDIKLPKISLKDLLRKHIDFANEINVASILKHFKEYLQHGYYPFFRELTNDYEKYQAIENACQKTIYEDISTLHSLKTPTLMIIEKLLKYVVNSQPGELSAYKLANLLNKDFENISQYLRYLEEAGLVRALYSNKVGKPHFKNPCKMYPGNTNLIYASYLPQLQDSTIGKVRETFAVNQLQNAREAVFYTATGDIKVSDYIFEIGGKNKSKKQIKDARNAYILADNILVGSRDIIPLYLIGFLY